MPPPCWNGRTAPPSTGSSRPRTAGSVPDSELDATDKLRMEAKLAKNTGSGPDMLLYDRSRRSRWERDDSRVGTLPVRPLRDRLSDFRSVRLDRVEGRVLMRFVVRSKLQEQGWGEGDGGNT